MENAVMIGIGIAIIWQGYVLFQRQKKLKTEMNELKKLNEDMNIEFSSSDGNGIELVKKQYPDLQLRDDHRTGLEEVKSHSISNHMNDPSERQTAKFIVENNVIKS